MSSATFWGCVSKTGLEMPRRHQEARRLIVSFSNAIALVSLAVAPATETLTASFPTMAPASQPPVSGATNRLAPTPVHSGHLFREAYVPNCFTSSTRRLRARPSRVSLVSFGREAPNPAGVRRPAAT